MCRNAGFPAVAVFALALGIGINTAVFTAYKATVARPLDSRQSRRSGRHRADPRLGRHGFLFVGASYLLRGLLYGPTLSTAFCFAGVSVLFLAIALIAAYPPFRRAMRVDPAVSLRYE
ncbi:MAG TPA: hypothetical protein VN924_18245 [Bryobacteraceae bacterium]|nr:hypothetical protein [Bryobacteraceae bacterium]